jgi:hypothetical protein
MAATIEQGFLDFVKSHGAGPLFYRVATHDSGNDPLKAKKPRYIQARQRLADWLRDLGISDPELLPNHAWRHTFKQIADRAGISERMSDYITGHAHKSAGAGYGPPILRHGRGTEEVSEIRSLKLARYVGVFNEGQTSTRGVRGIGNRAFPSSDSQEPVDSLSAVSATR